MAKSKDYYWTGKVHWCRPFRPNQWGKYSSKFYPSTESLEEIRKLKEPMEDGTRGIQTVIGKDEDGEYIALNRNAMAKFRGIEQAMGPVRVLDGTRSLPDGTPLPLSESELPNIGNGTDAMVKVVCYKHRVPTSPGKYGRAIRWEAIRIDNLVPFEGGDDFTTAEQQQLKGIADQPKAAW